MFLKVIPKSNSSKKIDNPKYTTLTKDTIVLDVMLQNYLKDSILDNVICENCSSGGSKSIKPTFTVSRYLKKPPSVLKIHFQRGTHDMTTGEAVKNELKVAIPFEYLYKQP